MVLRHMLAATGLVLASAAPAAAQEVPTLFGWTLDSVRGGVRYAPVYLGSDDYRAWFTGAVVLVRRDAAPTPKGAPDDGVSLGLIGTGPVTAGVPKIDDALIDLPLAKQPGTGGEKMHVDEAAGQMAKSRFRVIDRAADHRRGRVGRLHPTQPRRAAVPPGAGGCRGVRAQGLPAAEGREADA